MDIELEQMRVLFMALLGLVVVILVMLVAYVIVASRRARRTGRERTQESQLDKGLQTAWPARQTTGQVVALFRDVPGGALQVEVGGTRYARLAEIEDVQLKRQVVEAALDLVRFTGALGADSIAPAAEDKTYTWREDLRKEIRAQAPPAPSGPPKEEVEEQFLNLLSEIGPAPAPEKPNLATAFQPRWSSRAATRQEQPRSVVDDIEEIVQRRLLLIPALTGRDLHVRLGADETVHFLFEGGDYESPDDIPNMTARQLVKDAIQEWDETT